MLLEDAQALVLTFEIHFCSLLWARLDYLEKIQSLGFGRITTLLLVIKIPYPKSIMGEEMECCWLYFNNLFLDNWLESIEWCRVQIYHQLLGEICWYQLNIGHHLPLNMIYFQSIMLKRDRNGSKRLIWKSETGSEKPHVPIKPRTW